VGRSISARATSSESSLMRSIVERGRARSRSSAVASVATISIVDGALTDSPALLRRPGASGVPGIVGRGW
jgi:hypothetical protein